MKKLSKKITGISRGLPKIKKVKVANPSMLIWLFVPFLTLAIATHYFFEKPKNEVLGASTENLSETPSPESGININQKFNAWKWNGNGVASLIFTGAYKGQYDTGYEEISKKGFSAAISVPTEDIGLSGSMTWLNVKFLQFKGWEVISQSKNQVCDKETLKDKTILEDEVQGSHTILTNLGFVVNLYLAPCGLVTPEIDKKVKENYKGFVKFGIDTNTVPPLNSYNLITRQVNNTVGFPEIQKWIVEAKAKRAWLILIFPNIGEKANNNSISLELLDKTLDELANSGLQMALPGEVLKYDKR